MSPNEPYLPENAHRPDVPFVQVEATADLSYPPFLVRIWRKAESVEMACLPNSHADVIEVLHKHNKGGIPVLMAEIARLPRITAVQIVDGRSKHGVVGYTEWP